MGKTDHLIKFVPGCKPGTTIPADRTIVYEVLKGSTKLRAADAAARLGWENTRAANALRGLVEAPAIYPHVHRPEAGLYVYDASKPAVVVVPRVKAKKVKSRVPAKPSVHHSGPAVSTSITGMLREVVGVKLFIDESGTYYTSTVKDDGGIVIQRLGR